MLPMSLLTQLTLLLLTVLPNVFCRLSISAETQRDLICNKDIPVKQGRPAFVFRHLPSEDDFITECGNNPDMNYTIVFVPDYYKNATPDEIRINSVLISCDSEYFYYSGPNYYFNPGEEPGKYKSISLGPNKMKKAQSGRYYCVEHESNYPYEIRLAHDERPIELAVGVNTTIRAIRTRNKTITVTFKFKFVGNLNPSSTIDGEDPYSSSTSVVKTETTFGVKYNVMLYKAIFSLPSHYITSDSKITVKTYYCADTYYKNETQVDIPQFRNPKLRQRDSRRNIVPV